MFKRNSTGLAAAIVLAMMGGGMLEGAADRAQRTQAVVGKASRLDGSKAAPGRTSTARQALQAMFAGSGGLGRGKLPAKGWSVATDRRRARKARNIARHRKACKSR